MKKNHLLFSFFLFLITTAQSQSLLTSGPMLGWVEHRSALIWCEVSPEVRTASIRYWESNNSDYFYELDYKGELGNPYNPIKFELPKLKMDVLYNYEIFLNNKPLEFPYPLTFRTKKIWEYRTEAPDFSFIMGSCVYLNDAPYDRPQQPPYGQDPVILKTMANIPADFNLWLGDNLYYREADYSSPSGMNYRYSFQRAAPEMQPLLITRPNFAIWDDHDYGQNDSHAGFEYKKETLELFKNYWTNKTYGEPDNPGIYSKFQWSDCEFFLMDDRYYRSPNEYPDSINGKPNCNKIFWGAKQMQWLKDNLITSHATFKFIVTGSQALNPMNKMECIRNYPCEYSDLMSFISQYKINGLVFLTGDRHISEVIKAEQKNGYPLYDITSSPITSGVFAKIKDQPEFNNPSRVPNTLVMENNFTLISINTRDKDRVLKMQCFNKAGQVVSDFSVPLSELKFK
ncbi:MAG: alkaline phosphatase D family protein [Bacteroidota bacterium]